MTSTSYRFTRPSVPVRVFRIRDRRVFVHVHDAFNPSEHPHAGKGSSKGGQFVAKGTGGGGTATAKTKPTVKATKKKTPRVARGQATAGFQPLEKNTAGKGFTLPGGAPVPKHIAHIAIPPGWTKVRYNPDPNGHLLVVGCDKKGKQQPKYAEKHKESQAAYKFGRIQRLEPKFDGIMAKAKQQMVSDPNARMRDSAAAMLLVMHTGMRPGSDADTKADYASFGATTLQGQHIITENGKTIVRFVSGKNKGKEIDMEVEDPDIAKELHRRAKEAGPGNKLFPNTDARHVLNHAKSLAGASFKTKDFRTLLGTKTAADEVKNMPVPTTPAEYKKFCTAVAIVVSKKLGNTPVIALKDYISPHVFADWRLASGA